MSLLANWNDETNFRQVQFSVGYSTDNGTLSVDSIVPTKVSFLDKNNQLVVKSIGVHTVAGQNMLREQLKNSGQMETFSNEIANKVGVLASVNG